MRLILALIIGLLSSFYLTAFIAHVIKRSISSLFGLIVVIAGVYIGFSGNFWPGQPLGEIVAWFLVGCGFGIIGYHFLSEGYLFSKRIEKDFYDRHEGKFERFLEMLPGLLTWLAITSPIWLSFTLPFAVAYIILLADIYWLVTAIKIAILVIVGYKRMEYAKHQHWLERLKKDFPNEWDKYYHLLLIPTYNEAPFILDPAFEAIAKSNYPKEKVILAVGFEAWSNEENRKQVMEALKKYESRIGQVLVTVHELQEGERKGPATNRNCIVRNAVKELKKRGIKPDQVLATTLDADFVIHPEFLAGALHKYLSTPENERPMRSFTGVFLYNNNYWQAPTPMRLLAAGTAYWQLSEMVGSDKYINFASLSMNLQSILDIGLWIPNKVNDDSGFFWKAYYHFKGQYKVLPHYLPISADANLDVTLWKTFQNTYGQFKRWAYGVEHIPFIFTQYFKRGDVEFWDKTNKLFFITWSYFKWGTLALFITFGGLIIPLVNPHYSQSVLTVNLPNISSYILDGAFLGLFSTIYVHEKTAPPRPKDWNILQKIWSYVQWFLVPILLVTLATIPAIDAQTTLMIGKNLEFRVTRKARALT